MKQVFFWGLILLIMPALLNAQTLYNKAFDFSLYDLEGNLARLSDFKDKPLIIFFWTSWCPYCRKAWEDLNHLYFKFKTLGIEVLAINIGESKEKIKRFLSSHPAEFKVLQDRYASVADAYNILGIPAFALIDKAGGLRFNKNYFPVDDYQRLLLEDETER